MTPGTGSNDGDIGLDILCGGINLDNVICFLESNVLSYDKYRY